MNRKLGFSLIEVLVVLGIVSLLTAIAVPSYSSYGYKARRAEGMSELARVLQRQEKYYMNRMSYATTLANLGLQVSDNKIESEDGNYLVEATACKGSTIARCVLLTARPQGKQEGDGWLSIDSRGEKNWQKNTGGDTGWP